MRLLRLAVLALGVAACGDDDGTGPGGNATVEITNGSTTVITELYWSRCTETTWGANRLGSGTLAAGASRTFTVAAGCWDFLAVNDQDDEDAVFDVELESGEQYEVTVTF